MTAKRPDRTPPPPPEAGASLLPATLAPGQSLSREDLALAGEQLFGRWGWQTLSSSWEVHRRHATHGTMRRIYTAVRLGCL